MSFKEFIVESIASQINEERDTEIQNLRRENRILRNHIKYFSQNPKCKHCHTAFIFRQIEDDQKPRVLLCDKCNCEVCWKCVVRISTEDGRTLVWSQSSTHNTEYTIYCEKCFEIVHSQSIDLNEMEI